jgi:hypothetical protein
MEQALWPLQETLLHKLQGVATASSCVADAAKDGTQLLEELDRS